VRVFDWLLKSIKSRPFIGAPRILFLSRSHSSTQENFLPFHIFAARRNVPCRRRRVPLYPGWHLPRRAQGATMGPSCIYIRSNLGVGCSMGCRFIVSMKPPLQSTFRDYSSLSLERFPREKVTEHGMHSCLLVQKVHGMSIRRRNASAD
jgi:hypothetical protein